MTPPPPDARLDTFLWAPMRSRLRWPLAVCAIISAAAHLPVLGEHLHEAPYMALEFLVLIAACLLIAAASLICDSAALYALAAVTCGLAIAGYVLTRVVALPALADDVGNWFEPLGVASILAEAATAGVAVGALAGYRSQAPSTYTEQP